MSYEKPVRCPICKFQKAFCTCVGRIIDIAETTNMEEVALMLRNGKRHEECVRKQIHAEPIRATNKQVADRISEINSPATPEPAESEGKLLDQYRKALERFISEVEAELNTKGWDVQESSAIAYVMQIVKNRFGGEK